MTAWSGPRGGEPPGFSLKPFPSYQAEAAVGGPKVPIAFPVFGSTICA